MREPDGLYADGKRAFREAVATLAILGEKPEHNAGVIELYARATDDLAHYRRRWKAAGRPTTTVSEHGRELPHPLPKLIADQASHVAKLANALGLSVEGRHTIRRSVGRPQGTSQSPDRRPMLRVAKD
jgi:phage terminase small subunit